jgi:stearoyl-CoA desaturase (delta-9 desaturase)
MWLSTKMGATWGQAYHYTILRYIVAINLNWCVNSVAHYYGQKPYDVNTTATESPFWGTIMMGEGRQKINLKLL